ncbi:MAG TPA: PDZ domain-containing protein [Myxococcaceae bacterium]|nr:PDZ domain-containing protein [Myxococcaceae bacterium]
MSRAVRYRVAMSQPHSHLFEVEARFPAQSGPLVVALPVWTPGSYLVREFARHLQDLSATDEAGRRLDVSRLDKRSFQIAAQGKNVRLQYRVYANELTVRTSHLDGTHGYFNGATLFLYAEALRGAQHRVSVDSPPGWRPFSALDREGDEFVAADYDELIDSPFEVGPHLPVEFQVAGVPHQIVVWGGDALDREKLAADLQKVCEAESALFGGLPMRRYLFLIYLADKGRGGLEHKASTSLLFARPNLLNSKGWEDFLTLAAHEYFHLWNVKRIKPRSLVPFDYSQESYTQLLWAFEGTTSYYDNLLVRRAGLMSASRYLNRLGECLTALHSTPGRKVQTLAEASMMAWIKHYRPDENSPNSAISYYLKGEIVAALLDLEIRRATQDERSLDDVMRLLWTRYGDERGVPEDGVERAATEVASRDLSAFFDRAIRSTAELDYSAFQHVGLEVKFRVKESPGDKGGSPPRIKPAELKPKGWLGISIKGGATIASVLEGSPAMKAGLYADDDIVALDGYRVDGAGLIARCEEKRPGETAKVTVFRRDRLVEVEIPLEDKPADAAYLARMENPTEAQRAAFQAWLNASWEEAAT